MKTLKWREFDAKPKPEAKEERQIQRTGLWYGLDRWEETSLRWERTSSVLGKTKIEKDWRNLDKLVSWAINKEDDSVIFPVKRYEDACGDLEEHTQGTVVDRVKRLWRQVENVVKTSNYATKNSRMNSIKGGRIGRRSDRELTMSRISCSTIVRRCLRLMRRTFSKHNILEARRFRSSTFWKNDVSSARSFPQNFVSAEYYFEDIGNMMGIKHDRK
ncbi:hypothetical protein YC2023_072264 [Brassica napus]